LEKRSKLKVLEFNVMDTKNIIIAIIIILVIVGGVMAYSMMTEDVELINGENDVLDENGEDDEDEDENGEDDEDEDEDEDEEDEELVD